MPRLKVTTIVILLLFVMSLTGCSLFGGGEQLKAANNALKAGNVNQAIKITKGLLVLYPRNYRAKRMLDKIEKHLMREAQQAWQAKDYELALEKATIVLDQINSANSEAQAVQTDAKKYIVLAQAEAFMEANNPVGALRALQNAIKLDPNFKEALDLKSEVDGIVGEQIDAFLNSVNGMMEQGQYAEVEAMAQNILVIAPQNREVADVLREAKARMLEEDRDKNLNLARKFYEQGLYESAKEKAELVLQVDPENSEAMQLVENCKAELLKPELRVTGFTHIKKMVFVSVKVGDANETLRVREGEEFGNGDFKISKIDLEMKTVVITYLKTGSQQAITLE